MRHTKKQSKQMKKDNKKALDELDGDLFSGLSPVPQPNNLHSMINKEFNVGTVVEVKEGADLPTQLTIKPRQDITEDAEARDVTGLKNEINWREHDEHAYDGSKLNHTGLDPFDFPVPDVTPRQEGLDNEIKWKEPGEHAYNGSTINRVHLDPDAGPRYFMPANSIEVDKYGVPNVTPAQAEITSQQVAKHHNMLKRALNTGMARDDNNPLGASIMIPKGMLEENKPVFIVSDQKFAPFNFNTSEQKPKLWVAIDPGKNGGLCALTHDNIVGKWIIPLLGDDIDITALYKILSDLIQHYSVTVILEEVHSIFGSSASSNWTFGYVCGVIEAVVVSHKLRFIKVQPKTWQAEIWDNHDKSYKVKKPEQKKASIDTKLTSLKAAIRLFPGVDMRKSQKASVAHDGIVDSLLIGEFARRKNL